MNKAGTTEQAFRLHWARWIRRYPGRYIAVVDGEVRAVAKSRIKAFQKIEKDLPPRKEVGLFYIPTPKQFPMVLECDFPTKRLSRGR